MMAPFRPQLAPPPANPSIPHAVRQPLDWGDVRTWTALAPVTSHGPSGIGFVDFGAIDQLDVRAPVTTTVAGARGFNLYDGSLRHASFDSITTKGDGAVGVQVSKPMPLLEIRQNLRTSGGEGMSLVKGVQVRLKAIGLSVKPGAAIGAVRVGGRIETVGADVVSVEIEGKVGEFRVDGGVAARGPRPDAVHVRGDVPGLGAVNITAADGKPVVKLQGRLRAWLLVYPGSSRSSGTDRVVRSFAVKSSGVSWAYPSVTTNEQWPRISFSFSKEPPAITQWLAKVRRVAWYQEAVQFEDGPNRSHHGTVQAVERPTLLRLERSCGHLFAAGPHCPWQKSGGVVPLGQFVGLFATRHQHAENERADEQRRDIAQHVAVLRAVPQRLPGHEPPVCNA